ncbi:hypothetical protein AB6D75_19240 [Vibrio splendidus]
MTKCYFCHGTATTKEHVPPKQLFPKDMKRNLITVPSCELHNGLKSRDDDYLRFVLIGGLKDIKDKRFKSIVDKVIRSVERKPLLAKSLFNTLKPIYGWPSVKINNDRLFYSYESIARGIVFYECGPVKIKRYAIDDYISFLSDDIQGKVIGQEQKRALKEDTDKLFTNRDWNGANPLVFSYQWVKIDKFILVKIKFYSTQEVVVQFRETDC